MILARKMHPGKTSYFMDKFYEAVCQSHGFLLLDLKPTTPTDKRVLSNVIDSKRDNDVIEENNSLLPDDQAEIYHYDENHSREHT